MYTHDDRWSVVEARRRFADLVREATREPQGIYKRNRLVAVVVNPETFASYERWRSEAGRQSVASAFDGLRTVCAEEGYELLLPPRADRRNPFGDES